jgi:hypothetical protein
MRSIFERYNKKTSTKSNKNKEYFKNETILYASGLGQTITNVS